MILYGEWELIPKESRFSGNIHREALIKDVRDQSHETNAMIKDVRDRKSL
jgi:hypothetical protein